MHLSTQTAGVAGPAAARKVARNTGLARGICTEAGARPTLAVARTAIAIIGTQTTLAAARTNAITEEATAFTAGLARFPKEAAACLYAGQVRIPRIKTGGVPGEKLAALFIAGAEAWRGMAGHAVIIFAVVGP